MLALLKFPGITAHVGPLRKFNLDVTTRHIPRDLNPDGEVEEVPLGGQAA